MKPLKPDTQRDFKKCWVGRLLDYRVTLSILCMVTVPHKMVGLERMSDYRGVGLERCRIREVSPYEVF